MPLKKGKRRFNRTGNLRHMGHNMRVSEPDRMDIDARLDMIARELAAREKITSSRLSFKGGMGAGSDPIAVSSLGKATRSRSFNALTKGRNLEESLQCRS